jgi:HupE / UreJ protein
MQMNDSRALAMLALVVTMGFAADATAHSGDLRTAEVDEAKGRVSVSLIADASVAAAATGSGTKLDDEELEERADVVTAWLTRGIAVTREGVACPASMSHPPVLTERGVQIGLDFDCGKGGTTVLADTSLADDAGHRTLVLRDGTTTVLRAGSSSVVLSEAQAWTAVASAFAVEGAIHLVTGYDHVLFLLSLLFAAGVIARSRGTRVAAKEIAVVVTAFTVGHSVTLAIAALGLVTLPARLVESAIAASIIVAAVLNIARPESTVGRPGLALVFGLIHGFGFSSVLADVGLPAGDRVLALGFFNVGIELAQLAVVALVIPLLAYLARRERLYRRVVMHLGSVAIASLAGLWLVERAFGL